MTEENVKHWKEQLEFAKTIKDPERKQEFLTLLQQQKDEQLLECFTKQSARIKQLVKTVDEHTILLNKITDAIQTIQKQITIINEFITEQKSKIDQQKGAVKLLKILKYIVAAGGGAALLKILEVL